MRHFRGMNRPPVSRHLFFLISSLCLGACATQPLQPARSYAFSAGSRSADSLDVLVQAFIAEGYTPATVDAQSRVIHTGWAFATVNNCRDYYSKRPVQRYTAVLLPAGEQLSVTLRLDQYCCEAGRPAVPANSVHAPSEQFAPMYHEELPPEVKEELARAGLPPPPESGKTEAERAPAPASGVEIPAVPAFNPHKEDPTSSEQCVRSDSVSGGDQRTLDGLGAALQQHMQRAVGAATTP